MRLFFMTALLGVVTAQAAEVDTQLDTLKSVELQNVQVVATRATKKTPIAFTNMSQEQLKAVNFGQDIPYLLSLTPSITMTSDAGNGIGYTSLRVRGTDPSRINITANTTQVIYVLLPMPQIQFKRNAPQLNLFDTASGAG